VVSGFLQSLGRADLHGLLHDGRYALRKGVQQKRTFLSEFCSGWRRELLALGRFNGPISVDRRRLAVHFCAFCASLRPIELQPFRF
jgi:hypothetical protein